MARRTAKLKTRKAKASSSSRPEEDVDRDEDGLIVPDETKWKTMTPYGLFAISDKDGIKHKFKRGDIATILPQQRSPGDTIEPHEYWVGKILEIRADAGSEDSTIIWTKVRWFYNAEDASTIVKNLDTSHIGKFERLSSLHWDFVLPHTFNEVIPFPKLYTFPFLHNRKSKLKKKLSGGLGKAEEESKSISAVSSTTITGGGEEKDEAGIELNEQVPIGPEMFYWRYTVDVVTRKIAPKPGAKSCICSTPYSPDTASLLKGIMFFCPRPTCRTSFHLGCLKDKKSVYIPDDKEVIVPSAVLSSGSRRGRGRGRGSISQSQRRLSSSSLKGNGPTLEDDDEVPWITPRALRRLSTSPESVDSVDLLSLLRPDRSTPPQIIHFLERIYARQLAHYYHQQSTPQSHVVSATSAKFQRPSIKSGNSTKSGGSLIEVEDMLVEENDDKIDETKSQTTNRGSGSPKKKGGIVWDPISRLAAAKLPKKIESKFKQKQKVQIEYVSSHTEKDSLSIQPKVKPLTPTALLATLFLLPSPFPPSYASIASSSVIATNTSDAIIASGSNVDTGFNTDSESDTLTDMRDLLILASQPILQGAGYFPCLGPTGNVNLVLAARKLVWDALGVVGSLGLFPATHDSEVSISTTKRRRKGKRGGGGSKKSSSGTRFEVQELDEAQQFHDMGSDAQDAEQWRRVVECLQSVLNGWKKKLVEGGKVLPPGGEIDDGVIVRDGLLLPLPTVTGWSGDEHREQDGNIEMTDATGTEAQMVANQELEVEVGSPLRSGRKRKKVPNDGDRARKKSKAEGKDKDEDEILLRVDWACLSCGDLI